MDKWIATAEVAMGLELFFAAILIMVVNARYKHKSISRRSFHIQNLEVLVLAAILIGVEVLSIKFVFLRNKFFISIIELAVVALIFVVDRKITGKDSFIGGG